MTNKEKILIANLLELASDKFSNHGCNDLGESIWDGWTKEEREKLLNDFFRSQGDEEMIDQGYVDIADWLLMYLLAEKLKEESI